MIFKGLFDFKNQYVNIKWRIIIPILLLIIIGLIILNSTSADVGFFKSSFYKQILWFFLGINAFVITQYVRTQYLYDYSYLLFFLLIILLSLTFLSPSIEGAKRWVIFGPFYFQPSEFGKIIYVICLSRFISDNTQKNKFTAYFIAVLGFSIIPALIVFIQPDLGTAIVYLSVIFPMLFWSEFDEKLLFLMFAPIISVLTVSLNSLFVFYIWMIFFLLFLFYNRFSVTTKIINFVLNILFGLSSTYIWTNILKDHHRDRILFFLDPFKDPLGKGYQAIQSWISIGSGGLWGKGLGEGTQKGLNFLPVKDTDFIISVLAEELGFFTIIILLICISIFVYWCFEYLVKIENKFTSLLLLGLSTLIFMHMIINMSMVSGLLPVTGLPVPFISYGGSFFLTCSIIIGLINNIINNEI